MASTSSGFDVGSFLFGLWVGVSFVVLVMLFTGGFADAGAAEVCSGFGYPGGAVSVDGAWHCRPAPVLPQAWGVR